MICWCVKSTLMCISGKRETASAQSQHKAVKGVRIQSALEHVFKDLIMAGHTKSLILHATTRGVTDMSVKTGSWQDPLDARSARDPYEPAQCIFKLKCITTYSRVSPDIGVVSIQAQSSSFLSLCKLLDMHVQLPEVSFPPVLRMHIHRLDPPELPISPVHNSTTAWEPS